MIFMVAGLGMLSGTPGAAAAPTGSAARPSPSVGRVPVGVVDLGPAKAVGPVNNRGQVVVTANDDRTYLRTGSTLQPLEYQGEPINVVAMNDSGVLAGWVAAPGHNLPVRWERGTVTVLANPTAAEDFVVPVAVNARGQILLQFLHFDVTDLRAWGYLWDNGRSTQIGPSTTFTGVTDLNDLGQVIGGTQGPDGGAQGFRWDRARGEVPVVPPAGIGNGRPVALDNAGQVAGYGDTPGGRYGGFRWSGGPSTDLGTLGGQNTQPVDTIRAMNAAGTIVGTSESASGSSSVFEWTAGRMSALPVPAGLGVSLGINDQGLIALASGQSGGIESAAVWWAGVVTALPSLGGTTVRTSDFTNSNVIVGTSTTAGGTTHGVIWTVGAGPGR